MKKIATKAISVFLMVLLLAVGTSFMPAKRVTIEGIGKLSFETAVTISVGYEKALADTESLYPTGQVTWTNLDDSYLVVDDDPDSPDGNWADAVDEEANNICHVSFDTPSGTLNEGVDLQEIRIYVRRANSNATPDMDIWIYENGVSFTQICNGEAISSDSGALYSYTWDATGLSNLDGSGIEVYVKGTKAGGKNKSTVEYDAIEWVVDYSAAAPDISNTPASKGFGVLAESSSFWSNGSAPTFPLDDGECFFEVTNNSGASIDINVKATNFAGGTGWTLSGSPGENIVTMKTGKSGDTVEGDMVTLTTGDQLFINSLADTASIKWEVKLETGTFTDGDEKTSTITLTAVLE